MQDALEHHGGADLAIGCLRDDKTGGSLDDLVSNDHVATNGQAMHEVSLVGDCHLAAADGPVEVVAVIAQHLAVVGGTGDARAAPVLGVDEISILEGFHLVVLDRCIAQEGRVQFIALGVGDDDVYIGSIHPLHEGIGDGLRQRTGMGSPRENHLGALLASDRSLGDGNEVGKGLQRMHGGCLHGKNRSAAVLHKLVENRLCIVVLAIDESCERAYADDVAVASHDGNRLKQMLTLVAIHDDSTLRLELPCSCIYIEHDDIHAQVERCLLGGETCAQAIVEENEESCLVAPHLDVLEAFLLDLLCLGQCLMQIAEVLHVEESFHTYVIYDLIIYDLPFTIYD